MKNDPEYSHVWSEETRYLFDERIAILTDGFRMPPNAVIDQIARLQARSAHVREASFQASRRADAPCSAGFRLNV